MDPSRWPAQDANQPSDQSHPSSSAQSLLSVYPFASTTPTTHVAQHLSSLTMSATDVRPPPTFLYPHYYETANPPPYTEYDPGMVALQAGRAMDGSHSAYQEEHRQRALRLLMEEQETMRPYSSYPAIAPPQQSSLPQSQTQPPPQAAYSYPVYQANQFSAPLVQSFPYPQQSSLQYGYQQYPQPQHRQQGYPQQQLHARAPNDHQYQVLQQQQHFQSMPPQQSSVQHSRTYSDSSTDGALGQAGQSASQQTPESFNRFMRDTTAALPRADVTAPPPLRLETQAVSSRVQHSVPVVPPAAPGPPVTKVSQRRPASRTTSQAAAPASRSAPDLARIPPAAVERTQPARVASDSQPRPPSRGTSFSQVTLPAVHHDPAITQTPKKPRLPPVPPETDSPDPLMMGPLARRVSGAPEFASPDRTAVRPAHHLQPISPLKRKVSEGDAYKLGSPAKRKYVPEVSLDSPSRSTRTDMLTNEPSSPLTSLVSSPTQQRTQSHSQLPPTPGKSPRRPRLIPYVDVPPLPRSPRKSQQSAVVEEEYRSMSEDEEDDDESIGAQGRRSGVKASGKRTGYRDERAATEKLVTYLEDVFEADDTVPPSSRPGSPLEFSSSPTAAGPSSSLSFLSSRSTHGNPLLSASVMRKLTRYFEACAPSQGRSRRRNAKGGALSEVDLGMLTRILKILERSVKAGAEVEPFPASAANRGSGKATSKGKGKGKQPKGKKAAGKSKHATPSRPRLSSAPSTEGRMRSISHGISDSPSQGGPSQTDGNEVEAEEEAEEDDENGDDDDDLTDATVEKCFQALQAVHEGVLAADCCLALLTGDKLPKQLYSEDLILACLEVVKNALTTVIYPFVELSADVHGQASSALRHVIGLSSVSEPVQHISSAFQCILSVLPRIDGLISAGEHAMSESIIIGAVYIAVGPFFVVDAGTATETGRKNKGKGKDDSNSILGGKAGFRALRLSALSVIRSIFANHEEQRSWIVEEILTSLIKLPDIKRKGGQFRLRDGHSIHTVSALLLQLVQTTAHDLRIRVRKLNRTRATAISTLQVEPKEDDDEILNEQDRQDVNLYRSGLDSASKCAMSILSFLIQRSGKNKATKDSNEAEYRAILDSLVADLLTVLYWPEWPAASMLLSVACKFMVASLEDLKTSSDNAAKQMALDHLGTIAAHLRGVALRTRSSGADTKMRSRPRPLDEILISLSVQHFDALASAHREVFSHLTRRATEDQACESARELCAATWGQELANTIHKLSSVLENDTRQTSEKYDKRLELVNRMKVALGGVWKVDASVDVFDAGTDIEVSRMQALAEMLGATNALQNAFDPILNVILTSLGSSAVFMRTKALRAVGQIVTCDPDMLRQSNVRQSIETHLADNSSAVRDAAIELVGKYVSQEPELAGEYYERLSERIADTGLGVRKRVMKLLRALYWVVNERERRVDICTKLILRLQDEDGTVKDLAVKSLEELWFSDTKFQPTAGEPLKSGHEDKADIYMDVVALFRERGSVVEEMLQQILSGKEGKEADSLIRRYGRLCDALIDRLVDSEGSADFRVMDCMRGIYLLTASHPSVISSSKAEILLPYLKVPTTPEEQTITVYFLKVFRAAIPGMPKTALKFAQELQKTLLPMISKPPNLPGTPPFQELVGCLCSVVNHLTHDYARLVALLRSCDAKLQAQRNPVTAAPATPGGTKILNMFAWITALLVEHCDFDVLRSQTPSIATALDTVSPGPICDHVYETLLWHYHKRDAKAMMLQCLGIIFRAHPLLMMRESSYSLMDSIFASEDPQFCGRLLNLLQEFLMSESAKRSHEERSLNKGGKKEEVDIDELVGSSTTFADSGVSSGVVQRYLRYILEGAMSTQPATQRVAVEILGFTIKQGLAHPLQCLPVLIALETSPNATLSARAGALHSILQNKHASLMNSRFMECARMSFAYQAKITAGAVQGCRIVGTPIALLHRWYSLVREKRTSRQDLLKAIVKAFDVDSAKLSCSTDDVSFIRYMAENVSALDYKTHEEVFTVIKYLTSVLSMAGMQLVDALPRLDLGEWDHPMDVDAQETVSSEKRILRMDDPFPLLRASVAVGIVLVLKAHLKQLYGLSEEKCLKFVIGKKSTAGDKAATRKHTGRISFDRIPFASSTMLTIEDLRTQRDRFLELWAEDGVTAEPQDDMD